MTTRLIEVHHDRSKVPLDSSRLALGLLGFGYNLFNEILQLFEILRWPQQATAKIGDIFHELDPLLCDVLAC